MNSTKFMALLGILAIIGVSVYLLTEYNKSGLEKFGDDVEDTVKDATN